MVYRTESAVNGGVIEIVQGSKRKIIKKYCPKWKQETFTSYIKSKTKSRTNVSLLRISSEMISDDKVMTMILNRSFCSVFSQEDTTSVQFSLQYHKNVLFTEREVLAN